MSAGSGADSTQLMGCSGKKKCSCDVRGLISQVQKNPPKNLGASMPGYLSFTCMYMFPVLQVWNTITWSLQHLYPAHSWNFLAFAVFERHVWDLFKFFFFSATIRHLHVALKSLGQVNNVGVWVTLSETFFSLKKVVFIHKQYFSNVRGTEVLAAFSAALTAPYNRFVWVFFFFFSSAGF